MKTILVKGRKVGWLLVLIAFFGSSCSSPQRQYLPVTRDTNPSFPPNNPKRGTNYVLSVIEFDDQGEMWQRDQLLRTLTLIHDAKTNGNPVTLLVFVHGWKHDASPNSGNLHDFQTLVTNLAAVELQVEGERGTSAKPRQIVGVYVAWRGNICRYKTTLPDWLFEPALNMSFWNRKRVAAQVAGISSTEAILSLAAQTRLDYFETGPLEQSKVILVGHSFGGLLLERAVTQAMVGGLLATSQIRNADLRTAVQAEETGSRYWQEYMDGVNAIESQQKELTALKRRIADLQNATTASSNRWRRLEASTPRQEDLEKQAAALSKKWTSLFMEDLSPYRAVEREIRETLDLPERLKEFLQKRNIFWENIIWPQQFDATDLYDTLATVLKFAKGYSDGLQSITDKTTGQTLLETTQTAINELDAYSREVEKLRRSVASYPHNSSALQAAKGELEQNISVLSDSVDDLAALETRIERTKAAAEQSRRDSENSLVKARSIRQTIAKPPADLVLLVNPASEALVAKKMIAALNNPLIGEYSGRANEPTRPWIISVTSKGDWATRMAFPLGQKLGSLRQQFRPYGYPQTTNCYCKVTWSPRGPLPGKTFDYSTRTADYRTEQHHLALSSNYQNMYFCTTAPHNDFLLSHSVRRVATNAMIPITIATNQSPLQGLLRLNLSTTNIPFNAKNEFAVSQNGTNVVYAVLDRTNRLNYSGYWVVRAPRDLIPNHNTIFTTNFYAMAMGLLRISQAYNDEPRPNGNGITDTNTPAIVSITPH